MKKLLFTLLLSFVPLGAIAQSTHTVDLSWTASPDAAGNPTGVYNVYRAGVACTTPPLASSFVKVGSASATLNKFTDSAVPLGALCYEVTFSVNGAESIASNLTPAVVLPAPPLLVQAVVH